MRFREMSRRAPIRRALTCSMLLLSALALRPTHAAEAIDGPAKLRARAAAVLEERERARKPNGPTYETIYAHLVPVADSLAASGEDSLLSRVSRTAGDVAKRLGKTKEARRLYDRAVEAGARSGAAKEEAYSRLRLAGLLADTGHDEVALAAWQQLLSLAERTEDATLLHRTWYDLGRAYLDLGRTNESIDAARRALSFAEKAGSPGQRAYAYHLEARCLLYANRLDEGLVCADSLAAIAERVDMLDLLAASNEIRSSLLQGLRRFDEARVALDRAGRIHRGSRDAHNLAGFRFQLIWLELESGDAASALAQSDSLANDPEMQNDPDFEVRVINLRAAALANLHRYAEAESLLVDAIPRFQERRESFGDTQSRAGRWYRGGEMYSTYARCRVEQGDVTGGWEIEERGRASQLRRLLGGAEVDTIASLAEVQRFLREAHGAILEWNTGEKNPPLVYLVTPDTIEAISLPSDSASAPTASIYTLLSSGAKPEELADAFRRAAKREFPANLGKLPDTIERLFLVDTIRHGYLPCEELPLLPDESTTVGARFATSYVPSATILLELERRTVAREGMLIFADPKIEARSELPGVADQDASPLPYARDEAREIAIRGAQVWTGERATPSRLAEPAARAAAVLHFATHAVNDPRRPERSRLRLAGHHGDLTAAEIESVSTQADLVSLSGCRTAVGVGFGAEGRFGLSRSFLVAGARSVVASLWDVQDDAASRLMKRFYDGLRRGLPRDRALQQARLALARSGASPRDYAAFRIEGVGHEPVLALVGAHLEPRGQQFRWAIGVAAVLFILLGVTGRLSRRSRNSTGRSTSVDK
ncbi:MAG: CHAT domain-containing tetratricopeptide repeat protein [Candidatus Eisenbacteria bacterium]